MNVAPAAALLSGQVPRSRGCHVRIDVMVMIPVTGSGMHFDELGGRAAIVAPNWRDEIAANRTLHTISGRAGYS